MLRELSVLSGRRLRALHGVPILDRGGQPVGSISLLSASALLEASDWALLASFAGQAAQALERASAFEREHELASRLQQSLLPGT